MTERFLLFCPKVRPVMKILFLAIALFAALPGGAAPFSAAAARAGSCCGGGGGSSPILPRKGDFMLDAAFEMEKYDGFWNEDGAPRSDPKGSDLRQYRLTAGLAKRLSPNWQAGFSIPYVWNRNDYAGTSSSSRGIGDSAAALWWEAVGDRSIWKLDSWRDFIPSITLGASLTMPTGVSPYDDIDNNFDATGRGFYRLDGNILIEKTMMPWGVSLAVGHGNYFDRSVNREYGKFVKPYRKKFGDRFSASFLLSRRFFLGTAGDSLTFTTSLSHLREDDGTIDGKRDELGGFRKNTLGVGLAYSSTDHDWSFRLGWSHSFRQDGWGENFPITDVYTLGVRRVFR